MELKFHLNNTECTERDIYNITVEACLNDFADKAFIACVYFSMIPNELCWFSQKKKRKNNGKNVIFSFATL